MHTNIIKEKVDIIVKYAAPIPIKLKILLKKYLLTNITIIKVEIWRIT